MINKDPTLKNYEWHIRKCNDHYKKILHDIESIEQSLPHFTQVMKQWVFIFYLMVI